MDAVQAVRASKSKSKASNVLRCQEVDAYCRLFTPDSNNGLNSLLRLGGIEISSRVYIHVYIMRSDATNGAPGLTTRNKKLGSKGANDEAFLVPFLWQL